MVQQEWTEGYLFLESGKREEGVQGIALVPAPQGIQVQLDQASLRERQDWRIGTFTLI